MSGSLRSPTMPVDKPSATGALPPKLNDVTGGETCTGITTPAALTDAYSDIAGDAVRDEMSDKSSGRGLEGRPDVTDIERGFGEER